MDGLTATNWSLEKTAYDFNTYSSRVGWSRKCMWIDGRPVVIVSTEFQYFRIPDVRRWPRILRQYRAMGFNAVRLYFHWGYHSPLEGEYIFHGARDVSYLLTLCEQFQLFVIAAPGPYICAETHCGGYPTWLVARRALRIRHLRWHFMKKFDEAFSSSQKEWFRQIMPILKKHERTTNPHGCIILLQLENELLQRIPGITFCYDDEIRSLAETTRELGVTLPVFHNDDSPHGSWSSGDRNRYWKYLKIPTSVSYRTDMYGADLYFVFAPRDSRADVTSLNIGPFQFCGVAACLQFFCIGGLGVGGDETKGLGCLFDHSKALSGPNPEGWSTKEFGSKLDHLERELDGFGGAAQGGPVIMAETQVGWINQWARRRNYDHLYDYFGDFFSATLLTTLAANGLTVTNQYSAYGGTNYGCSGDSEVYTSYDYSGFIREYGMLSRRGREFRQKALFLRSFVKHGIGETAHLRKIQRSSLCSIPSMVVTVRRALRGDGGDSTKPVYMFLRNFVGPISKEKPRTSPWSKIRFTVAYDGVVVPCELAYRDAMTIPVNIPICLNLLNVHLCSLPVLVRGHHAGAELWVLRLSSQPFGRVVLRAMGDLSGVEIHWSLLDREQSGELTPDAGGADGHTAAQWQAPLEELSQADFEATANADGEASTRADSGDSESALKCKAFASSGLGPCIELSILEPCVVAVRDPGNKNVLCRFLAISEKDADTFVAQVDSSSEAFSTKTTDTPFACAWGANEIGLFPDGSMVVETFQGDDRAFYVGHKAPSKSSGFRSASKAITDVLPGTYQLPDLHYDPEKVCPGGRRFEVPLEPWIRRPIDWSADVVWKPIAYAERDPLDHHFTNGYIAYRCLFETARNAKVTLSVNVRHIGMVYCDGNAVESQRTYSHNALSAGAMHAVDFTWAGRKWVDLTPHLVRNSNGGSHQLLILVHSLGQGRQPFLLNDVRNRRGLISASLSRSARHQRWSIFGVPVSSMNDPFNTAGLPLEEEVSALELSEQEQRTWTLFDSKTPNLLQFAMRDGIQWLRTSFTAAQIPYRFPLNLILESTGSILVVIWLNQVIIGRYASDLGPQSNFYLLEDLLHRGSGSRDSGRNVLCLSVLPLEDTQLTVKLGPWIVDPETGNVRRDGVPFLLQDVLHEVPEFRVPREHT